MTKFGYKLRFKKSVVLIKKILPKSLSSKLEPLVDSGISYEQWIKVKNNLQIIPDRLIYYSIFDPRIYPEITLTQMIGFECGILL